MKNEKWVKLKKGIIKILFGINNLFKSINL
jgi:hypothetical protein